MKLFNIRADADRTILYNYRSNNFTIDDIAAY